MMYPKRLDTVMIIEDNKDHMTYTRDALDEGEIAHCIIAIEDGQAALDYLFRQNVYSNPIRSPRPALILLDLRLPKIEIRSGIAEDSRHTPHVMHG